MAWRPSRLSELNPAECSANVHAFQLACCCYVAKTDSSQNRFWSSRILALALSKPMQVATDFGAAIGLHPLSSYTFGQLGILSFEQNFQQECAEWMFMTLCRVLALAFSKQMLSVKDFGATIGFHPLSSYALGAQSFQKNFQQEWAKWIPWQTLLRFGTCLSQTLSRIFPTGNSNAKQAVGILT